MVDPTARDASLLPPQKRFRQGTRRAPDAARGQEKFEASALFEFLGRVDRELAAPCIIFLIGGSAVSIIDPAHSTSDVDLLSPGSEEFDAAVARLRARDTTWQS